ncbi:MAG: lytic murein transglycosylase B [Methylococcales bacterium]|nr:lytic murein transglycosylase B [Methylococcales bacterium]
MKSHYWIICVLLSAVVTGCTVAVKDSRADLPVPNNPNSAQAKAAPTVQTDTPALSGAFHATRLTGDYADYAAVKIFIEHLVAQHGFRREYLYGLFSEAKRKQWTLNYLRKSDRRNQTQGPPGMALSPGSWSRYRAKFVDPQHIKDGVAFWQHYRTALQRAEQAYGVPAEYILAILGVETRFGGFVGNHRIIDALTTLAFDYSRRADYFRTELENYLIMASAEGFNPTQPKGSYAGAMGLGQFMPSSFLNWAVDFNGDGHKNLWTPVDAIGSVAHYLQAHGWQTGRPVVTPAKARHRHDPYQLETGYRKQYSLAQLKTFGITPKQDCPCQEPVHVLFLSFAKHHEYWLGHANFYVITRYNHSSYYAMAVHDLAQAIKQAWNRIVRVQPSTERNG